MIDGTGTFKLKGFTRELSDIDPVLYVWTDCNDGNTVMNFSYETTLTNETTTLTNFKLTNVWKKMN